MVAREDLVEDLLHVVQATQWPNDRNNSTLARNGANRVPKPPRTPHTTPASNTPTSEQEAPIKKEDIPAKEENGPVDKTVPSCFNFERLMSSFDPTFNLDVQSQCNQVCTHSITDEPYRPLFDSNKCLSPYSVANGKEQLDSGTNKPSCAAPGQLGSSQFTVSPSTTPLTSSPPVLERQLSTKTQQVLQLLLCEVYAIGEDELQKIISVSHRRKSAEVNLDVTIETSGCDGNVHCSLKLLGGKSAHARDLRPPLPPLYSTTMPVDNLWSQQLLLCFSKKLQQLVENNKNTKKIKTKKTKKTKDAEQTGNQTPVSKAAAHTPAPSPGQLSPPQSVSRPVEGAPDTQSLTTPHKPGLHLGKAGEKLAAGGATLQRGLQGIRRSINKKKKKLKGIKADDGCPETAAVDVLDLDTTGNDECSVHTTEGIKTENASTPFREVELEVKKQEKHSKSPFQRFGSLKLHKKDLPFRHFGKLKGPLRKSNSNPKVDATVDSPHVEPLIVSKEELIITSQPLLDRSGKPNVLNPFADIKEGDNEEFDSTNPFSPAIERSSERVLTPTNISSALERSGHSVSVLDSESYLRSKSKDLRRSMRKTFSRIGSVRKKKKHSSDYSVEEVIPLNTPEKRVSVSNQSEQVKNENLDISKSEIKSGSKTDPGKDHHWQVELEEELELELSGVEPKPIYTDVFEELAYKMFQLQDAASRRCLEERIQLPNSVSVLVTLKLDIDFETKCTPFELYRNTFETLYRRRFRELIPMKPPLEGVDCNATVDGEMLLRQLSIFCPISPRKVALARLLVLVEAATGKMGTPNTINARTPKKKDTTAGSTESTHLVEVHSEAASSVVKKLDFATCNGPTSSSPARKSLEVPTSVMDSSASVSTADGGASANDCVSPPPSGGVGSDNRNSTSSTDEPPGEYVYNQKAETILINPSDLLILLQRVDEGLKSSEYSVAERLNAVRSCVSLCRWIIGHHLERLQTVFPAAVDATEGNLSNTLRCLQLVENSESMREHFEAETADLGLGDLRNHVLWAVKKYTQLWVRALLRETSHRIDAAMKQQSSTAPTVLSSAILTPAAITPKDTSRAPSTERLLEEGRLPFNASGVAEVVPALVTSFVRTVKQFENNRQIVYLADMVERSLGMYRPTQPLNALESNVTMPMIGSPSGLKDDKTQTAAEEDEINELVLRLGVVGDLMPVIVDFLDVARHVYDPIFKKHFSLEFLASCWSVLVDGAMVLWQQIGVSGSLRETLCEPPLKADHVPQAISAVWSLCQSYSAINRLGSNNPTGPSSPSSPSLHRYHRCMEDCVMCWLQLIGQRAQLQLHRDLQGFTSTSQYSQLEDLTRDTLDLIKLVVQKTESLVWPGQDRPSEVLSFLGYQLTVHLDTFWRTLYLKHRDTNKKPNVISYWSCRIMDSLTECCDALVDALEQLDPARDAVAEPLTSLELLPQKAARVMCYQELRSVEEWVSRAASGGGGGALVRLLDEALTELYDCLAPAQPLVACLRDRLLDATAKHLDDVTQEEEFNQLAAVLEALQQFFTTNILLEESLAAAESRWAQQLSDARERGRPLAELQHSYYSARLQEQALHLPEDLSAANTLIINVVFIENFGLSVSIIQVPSAYCIVKAAHAPLNNNNHTDGLLSPKLPPTGGTPRPAPKTTGIFTNMFKGAGGVGGVYVKAQLVPADWFPEAVQDYKTSLCKDDPAVIDEEIDFPGVHPVSPGVEKGGFLLLRLKLTRRMRSQVVGEALLPLSGAGVQLVARQDRRTVRHSQLPLTRPSPLHTYEPLNILKRRNDEVSCQFLTQLEQDTKGQQRAAIRGSNTSLSSMW